jgi:hypothetical protein
MLWRAVRHAARRKTALTGTGGERDEGRLWSGPVTEEGLAGRGRRDARLVPRHMTASTMRPNVRETAQCIVHSREAASHRSCRRGAVGGRCSSESYPDQGGRIPREDDILQNPQAMTQRSLLAHAKRREQICRRNARRGHRSEAGGPGEAEFSGTTRLRSRSETGPRDPRAARCIECASIAVGTMRGRHENGAHEGRDDYSESDHPYRFHTPCVTTSPAKRGIGIGDAQTAGSDSSTNGVRFRRGRFDFRGCTDGSRPSWDGTGRMDDLTVLH